VCISKEEEGKEASNYSQISTSKIIDAIRIFHESTGGK